MFKRSAVVIAGAAGTGALLVVASARPRAHWGTKGRTVQSTGAPWTRVRRLQQRARSPASSGRVSRFAPAATRGSAALRAAGACLRPAPRPGGPRQERPRTTGWFWSQRDPRWRTASRAGRVNGASGPFLVFCILNTIHECDLYYVPYAIRSRRHPPAPDPPHAPQASALTSGTPAGAAASPPN